MSRKSIIGWIWGNKELEWDLSTEEYSQYAGSNIPKIPSLYQLWIFLEKDNRMSNYNMIKVKLTIQKVKKGIVRIKPYTERNKVYIYGYTDIKDIFREMDNIIDEFHLKEETIAFYKDKFYPDKIRFTVEKIKEKKCE